MIAQLIQNSLTGQGTIKDVQSRFTINDAIKPAYSSSQLRAITASESLPRTVAGFIPKVMGNVSFTVSVKASASGFAEDDLDWIRDQVSNLLPWMVQAQTSANIVGKSYLIYDAERLAFDLPDRTFVNQDIPVSPVNLAGTPFDVETSDLGTGVQRGGLSVPINAPQNPNNRPGVDTAVTSDQVATYYPMLVPINWREEQVQRITPFHVVAGDNYVWTSDRKYLYRRKGTFGIGLSGYNSTRNVNGVSSMTVRESDVNAWVEEQLTGAIGAISVDIGGSSYQTPAERIVGTQYEVIEASHVIELTAFDYQDDSDCESSMNRFVQKAPVAGNGLINVGALSAMTNNPHDEKKISYRLTRFIAAFLRYISFVNACLNRMHRSEFIAYAKENLGDINLDIARALAQTQTDAPDGTLPTDPVAVIQAELERILESATNLGIVMYDAKNKVELVSRSMSGIDKLHAVFMADLIAASQLTEFTLFGRNDAGSGLASLDVRDRKFIADQSDNLWADHWQPPLLLLAQNLSYSTDAITNPESVHLVPEKSFKLTDQESGDYVKDMIAPRVSLVQIGAFSPQEIRREILGNSLLSKYFNITVVEGEEPQPPVTQPTSQQTPNTPGTPAGTDSNENTPAVTVRQGDATPTQIKNQNDAIALHRLWQAETNMNLVDMERWRIDPRSQFGTQSTRTINRVARLMAKPVADYTRRDINAIKTEVATLRRMKARWVAGTEGQPVKGAGVSRMFIGLMSRGYRPTFAA